MYVGSVRQNPDGRVQYLEALSEVQERILIFLDVDSPSSLEPLVHIGQGVNFYYLLSPKYGLVLFFRTSGLFLKPHSVAIDKEGIRFSGSHLLE